MKSWIGRWTFPLVALAAVALTISCSTAADVPESTPVAKESPDEPPAPAGPTQDDHWHSVYGVYSCDNPGEGDAKYLPGFLSDYNATGLHSHGDGVMHVHPFVGIAAGANARLGLWAEEMRVKIASDRIVVDNEFDPPTELVAGEPCADGTGVARIVVLKWQFESLVTDTREEPTAVFEQDLDQIRFENDREVFIIAHVGADTDLNSLPLPPQERFANVANASPDLEYNPKVGG